MLRLHFSLIPQGRIIQRFLTLPVLHRQLLRLLHLQVLSLSLSPLKFVHLIMKQLAGSDPAMLEISVHSVTLFLGEKANLRYNSEQIFHSHSVSIALYYDF